MTTYFDGRRALIGRNGKSRAPRWLRFILGVPLEMKLLGANLIILAVAAVFLFGKMQLTHAHLIDAYVVATVLILGAMVNFVLVRLALGPIASLERVARLISEGRLAERVPASLVADRELARLSRTINEMLDSLAAGRERVERFGAEVVYAEERERSAIAQELHESVGQKLADASFEITASTNEMKSDVRASHLAKARGLLQAAIEEIRSIARSSHLRVVTDVDLPKALESLERVTPPRSLNNVRSAESTEGLIP